MSKFEKTIKDRKIIHVDMDAFFAQIEQRDNPGYKNTPLIVGGPLNRGVISSASYEARKYGLHAGMPLSKAKKLCPDGVYVAVNMEKYLDESKKIKDIFFQFTPLVETVGCDEGFLDVSGCEKLFGDTIDIARKIKGRIYEQTNLTSSAGIGPNKFFAKLASNIGKPNGLVRIENKKEVLEKIKLLPVSYIWGVGRVMKNSLKSMGIETIGDISNTPVEIMKSNFGELGEMVHKMSEGIDNREIIPHSRPKSVGRETTFSKDTSNMGLLKSNLLSLSQRVSKSLRDKGFKGNIITLKIRFSDFRTITRRITIKKFTSDTFTIFRSSVSIIEKVDFLKKRVRLVGISVSNLKSCYELGDVLFDNEHKEDRLFRAVDMVSEKFGDDKLTIAEILKDNSD